MKLRYSRQFVGIVCLIGVIPLSGCRKDKGSVPADTAKADTAKADAAKADTAKADAAKADAAKADAAKADATKADAAKADAAKADENLQVIAKLAKADLLDGTEDNVVHRCGGCQLGMDGDETNALTVGKYQMHFCSSDCLDGFAKDPSANILALAIPEGD